MCEPKGIIFMPLNRLPTSQFILSIPKRICGGKSSKARTPKDWNLLLTSDILFDQTLITSIKYNGGLESGGKEEGKNNNAKINPTFTSGVINVDYEGSVRSHFSEGNFSIRHYSVTMLQHSEIVLISGMRAHSGLLTEDQPRCKDSSP